MANHAIGADGRGRWARAGSILLHEFRKMLPPTIFFFIGFNIILLSKRLLLADHLMQLSGFILATTSSLVVGKTVLVANMMPVLRRFDHEPLICPILFKTVVYTCLVFVARLLEAFVHYVIQGGNVGGGGFLRELLGSFSWDHFIVVQLWVFILFLIYVSVTELNELFGDGELYRILLTRRTSEVRAKRRARRRLLAQLSRLVDAYSIETLTDSRTSPHAELVAILRSLTGLHHRDVLS